MAAAFRQAEIGDVALALLLGCLAFAWRKKGVDLFKIPKAQTTKRPTLGFASAPEEVALSSASSKVRKENEKLKAKLAQLEASQRLAPSSSSGEVPLGEPPVPPPGAPELPQVDEMRPGASSSFGEARKSIAQHTQSGPMVTSLRAGAVKQVEVGQVIHLQNFKNQPSLNGRLAVVQNIDSKGVEAILIESDGTPGGSLKGLGDKFWRPLSFESDLSNAERAAMVAFHSLGQELEPVLNAATADIPSDNYAPLAAAHQDRNEEEARKVKDLLSKWQAKAVVLGTWH